MHILPGKFLLYIARRDTCSVWVDRDLGSKALRDARKHKRREARGARRAASVIEVGRKKQAMGLEDDTRVLSSPTSHFQMRILLTPLCGLAGPRPVEFRRKRSARISFWVLGF